MSGGRVTLDARPCRQLLQNAEAFTGPAKTSGVRLSIEAGPDASAALHVVTCSAYVALVQRYECLATRPPHRAGGPWTLPATALRRSIPNAKTLVTIRLGDLYAETIDHRDLAASPIDYVDPIGDWRRPIGDLTGDIAGGFALPASTVAALNAVSAPTGGAVTWSLYSTNAAAEARPLVLVAGSRSTSWAAYAVVAGRPIEVANSADTLHAITPRRREHK